jgi:DNA-binding MarR family transcriptional regulator
MERLPQWLQSKYSFLCSQFGQRSFSQEDVMHRLAQTQTNVADLLSGLEHAGYVIKETDPFDQRLRSYRLADVMRARQLDDRLEVWRQEAVRNAPPLAQAIDRFWGLILSTLGSVVDLSATPEQPGSMVLEYVDDKARLGNLRVIKVVKLDHLEKEDQIQIVEILKLFDASSNAYRSLTNVLLEHKKLHRDLAAGVYDLRVGDYVAIDGVPLRAPEPLPSKSLCPICRRFRQNQTALALITGNPKMDSSFQTYRSSQATRTSMRVCSYCFTAGWVDLPTALVTKDGQSVGKGREYLFITTPLSREDLQRLLDVIARRDLEVDQDTVEAEEVGTVPAATTTPDAEEVPEGNHDEDLSLEGFGRFLQEKYGIEGLDSLAVLGLSARRMRELRGLVLPSANRLQRVVAVRVPVERLVGEDRVSGAVRRELVKATMYDFWLITGGSLHYNRVVPGVAFSVEGRSIELEDMRRSNAAYYIADRYARIGRYRQLSSGLFMLLLSKPRQAANRILRARHRVRSYAPGKEKIREVIELAESIAQQDWKFDLGLRIVQTLVELDLLKRVGSFRSGPGPNDVFTGVELVKWLQRLKMIRDETSARAWGNMLLNALKRGDRASKEYILARGGQVSPPGREKVGKILDLVDGKDGILQTCARYGGKLPELARDLADMDYYLLFYYNQRHAAPDENEEETK